MARKYTKVPADTFKTIQRNAGILLSDFDPSTGEVNLEDILGATTGGTQFRDQPSYEDFGSDIDNCPTDTMELKEVTGREISLGGTYVAVTAERVKQLMAAADSTVSNKVTKIVPRDVLKEEDFEDFWWVGDYAADGGFIAVHIMNALNVDGFQLTSGDKAKGQFPFNYRAHYSLKNQETVPYEVYVTEPA